MAFPAGTFAEGEDIDSGLREALSGLGVEAFSFRIEAIGARYEPLQAQRPVGSLLHPSDFKATYLHDPRNDRMRLSWQRSILEHASGAWRMACIGAGIARKDMRLTRSTAKQSRITLLKNGRNDPE